MKEKRAECAIAHRYDAWFEHSPAFALAFESPGAPGATPVASYPHGNPLMSGWLLRDSLLQGRNALMDSPRLRRGRVVLFGFRPQYRGLNCL